MNEANEAKVQRRQNEGANRTLPTKRMNVQLNVQLRVLKSLKSNAYLIVEGSVVRVWHLRLLGVRRLRGGEGPRHGEDVLQELVFLTQAFGG